MASLDAALNRLAIAIDALEARLPGALASGKAPKEVLDEVAKLKADRAGMQEEIDRLRAEVRALSVGEARAALEAEDPAIAVRLHAHDSQRNARALEVVRATGQSLALWQKAPPVGGLAAEVDLRPQVIDIARDTLVRRIDARVAAMWAEGALEEVRHLATRGLSPTLPVMRAIGVPPLLALLAGELGEAPAQERWRLDTRQYAKRQATWLRNQTGGWPRIAAA